MKDNYYVFESGELKREDDTLVFVSEDEEKTRIPVQQVECLYIHGQLDFNTRLASFANEKGIEIHIFGWNGRYAGSLIPKKNQVSGQTVVQQVRAYDTDTHRLNIAKKIVEACIENMNRNLKYYERNSSESELFTQEKQKLLSAKRSLNQENNISGVMGREAEARSQYYKVFSEQINQFDFESREYYPPKNEINAVISYLNQILYTNTLSAIRKTALDPTVSFLHEPGERRYSLALDLADLFKPLLVTRTTITLFNTSQLTDTDFRDEIEKVLLDESGRKAAAKKLEENLQSTIEHPELNRHVSYQYLLQLEAYKLKRHLLTGEEYSPFTKWW